MDSSDILVVVDVSQDTDSLAIFLLILKCQAVFNIYACLPDAWIALNLLTTKEG